MAESVACDWAGAVMRKLLKKRQKNKCVTDQPTDRPTDTVGYSINKTICIIEFNQAVIQFPCKCVVASVVLGCNKNIITKEKIGLWVFWTNLYI